MRATDPRGRKEPSNRIWKIILNRKSLALLFAFFSAGSVALAEDVTFTYTPATEWSNGDPLALSDIRSTRVYCGDPASPDPFTYEGEPGADGEIVRDLPAGTWLCYATHTVTIESFLAKNPGLLGCASPGGGDWCESLRSNNVTTGAGTPVLININPPSNLVVQ